MIRVDVFGAAEPSKCGSHTELCTAGKLARMLACTNSQSQLEINVNNGLKKKKKKKKKKKWAAIITVSDNSLSRKEASMCTAVTRRANSLAFDSEVTQSR